MATQSTERAERKRQVGKRLAVLSACLLEAVLLLFCVVHLTYMRRAYTRLAGFYGLPKNSADVVFVGDSVTFSSFMPMEAFRDYGIAAANYCTNMMFENALRYSLTDVARNQRPKVILVDIAPFLSEHYAGNESWSEQDRDLYISYNLDSRNYTPDRLSLVYETTRDRKGSPADYLYYFFDLSRCHANPPDLARWNNEERDITRGYGYLVHNGMRQFSPEELCPDDGSVIPLNDCEQLYLDQLLETARGMEAEVVFYTAPVYHREHSQVGRKNYVKKYIEQKGFPFMDFSGDVEAIGLDLATDFWSPDHFDSLGALKVTKHFCEYLKTNFALPDRREDPAYAVWTEDIPAWKQQLDEWIQKDGGAAGCP